MMWIPVCPVEVTSSSISRMKSAPACNFSDSLPSAHSCLIPFRRPTTKSKQECCMGDGRHRRGTFPRIVYPALHLK